MSKYVSHGYGWACVDCLMMLANGENEPWTEEETEAWRTVVSERLGSVSVDLGGEHEEGCPNVDQETGAWIGSSDCYCEREEFSWRACDVCGSRLGGSRDAVHFFTYEDEGKVSA
jgi:hypothetical protein